MEGEKNNTRIDYSKRKKSKRKKPANLSCLKMPRDASREILQKKEHKKFSKNKKRV
jgi:hypothetical protein